MSNSVVADTQIEWTRDLGRGRLLVMERTSVGFRAALIGFRGVGATQDTALDDLLARVRDYNSSADEFLRSSAPGGELHEKMRQIERLVDQVVATHGTTEVAR